MQSRTLRTVILLAWVAMAGGVCAQKSSTPDALRRGFQKPPATARPWVFWMWLRVQTSQEAITRDVEAMHSKGIEGAILYDSGVGGGMEASRRMVVGHKGFQAEATSDYSTAYFTAIPEPPMPSWQPASREMVRFAAREAGRVGLKLVLTIGLASTSGDISLEDSQQRLVWSKTGVAGSSEVYVQLAPLTNAVISSKVPVRSMVPELAEVGAQPEEQRAIAVMAVPAGATPTAALAIDLSKQVDEAGRLQWHAPPGRWDVYRFGYEPTHMRNAWGLYTDAMSKAALDHTWEVTVGKLMAEMSPEERRGLYGVEDDSWEAGASTWTATFADEFQRRRGYNLLPWLPVLADANAHSPNADGVRRDYYRTIADLIAENHYGHLAELARRNHLVSYSEAAGPNSGELDPEQNASAIDVPMGEFWMPSQHRPTPDRRFLVHDAASSAHIYGHRVLGCEGLTSVGPHWEESLFDLKNTADQGFTEGCNLVVIHNFSQSPSVDAKPGYVYFAGTHYNRNTTWWDETPAFNDYLGRTSFLLQQGHVVADALYFRGDGIGQLEQRKQPLPTEGYDHDNINLDALLHRLSVCGGKLVLPDGMSYRLLVLPADQRMSLEALQKIVLLLRAGAVIVGPQPTEIDGVATPAQQRTFAKLVAEAWHGNGHLQSRIVHDIPAAAALASMHLAPDLRLEGVSSEGEIDSIHRKVGSTDIYFVTSRWDPMEHVTATFRVSGKQPELWDPVTGSVREAAAFQQQDGTTTVPLDFSPRGSIFVVFQQKIAAGVRGAAASNQPTPTQLAEVNGSWQVHFDPKWGGPEEVTFDKLTDWTQRPEEGIRHYSGRATYRTTFALNQPPHNHSHLLLDLGEVHEEAQVNLNGVPLGIVWTKPATIDISRAAHAGENKLEISVVNLWPNRLIGDEALPPDRRYTVSNSHKFGSATPLLPSGLIGPVRLLMVR